MFTLIFFKSFYHVLLAAKRTKSPVTGKISHNSLLLTSRKRHPSVGCCLPLKAARCHSGAPGLVRFSVMKKNNATALQTGPRLFPECQRPLTVILMVSVFFDISIARAKVRGVFHCKW